jgi:sugar/nucleoside kinase (ribokinase family)
VRRRHRSRRGVSRRGISAAGRQGAGNGFFVVNGGCAANAAVAIARLGGRALLAGPIGEDDNGDRVLRAVKREHVDCTFCQRIPGLATALSTIFVNTRGDRTIVTYCDKRPPSALMMGGNVGSIGRK